MSKLLKLKQYLTVEEAVKHLSNSIEESVSLADLYRLVLDEHLLMSVRFSNQAYAKAGQYLYNQDDQRNDLVFDKLVHVIDGIWDLAMIGTEAQEIEALYQKEVGGTGGMLTDLSGFCLKQGEVIFKLQESLHLEGNQFNRIAIESRLDNLLKSKGLTIAEVYESDFGSVLESFDENEVNEFMLLNQSLMRDENNEYIEIDDYLDIERANYQFVIKTAELTRFIQSLQDEPSVFELDDKPLAARERNTLLVLIGALLNGLNIDPSQRGVTPAVEALVQLNGTSLSDDTIREILREVGPAVEARKIK